ncbi:MAG: protein phosphatase 2C domain-containing protein, partial [Rikenellaceae bacterium]
MEKVTIFGNTDMGRIRTNNEDSFIIQNIWDGDHILAVVIDGVGGYEGGEVAAELARNSIVEYLEEYPNGERVDLLKQAVIDANNKIFAGRETLELENMSCVLTSIIVEVKQRRICMAHVGDTRLYQYAYGEITKLSHDHSLVGYREEIGELTEEQAMKHPQRNIIGRDVGSSFLENSGHDYVEVATFPLIERSTLMLCSDGLCDMFIKV